MIIIICVFLYGYHHFIFSLSFYHITEYFTNIIYVY